MGDLASVFASIPAAVGLKASPRVIHPAGGHTIAHAIFFFTGGSRQAPRRVVVMQFVRNLLQKLSFDVHAFAYDSIVGSPWAMMANAA